MKPIIDKIISITISKKLSVLVIATFLALEGKLESEDWMTVACIYIGSQAVIDSLIRIYNAKK